MNTMLMKDGYKVGHIVQYPENTEMVYSNFTARSSRIDGVDSVVLFGLQYFIKKYLIKEWNDTFFSRDKEEAVQEYKDTIDNYLGPDAITMDHVEALHDLGYLPVEIKAVAEGTAVPIRVPMFTIHNTLPEFAWVTNMLETIMSCVVWGPCTSATIAKRFRGLLDDFAEETSDIPEFVDFQAHDFSMRGMNSLEAAMTSGGGHLLSFKGTDTLPAIKFLEKYYNADSSKELIGASVPATEHSVMCMGSKEGEEETYRRIIQDLYPSGIVSVVSDTWDFWGVVTKTLPKLRSIIMERDGCLVIRPDSGDPVKILTGDPAADVESVEYSGLIAALYKIFGGTTNSKGYIQLDPHIGAIYGDAITYDRAKEILSRLKEKGFASTNVVFGVGSYTYQYNTRDTFGFAMKATAGKIGGKEVQIFKDPKTDNGVKKSAKGFLQVVKDDSSNLRLVDELNLCDIDGGEFLSVFLNGELKLDQSLSEIRERM